MLISAIRSYTSPRFSAENDRPYLYRTHAEFELHQELLKHLNSPELSASKETRLLVRLLDVSDTDANHVETQGSLIFWNVPVSQQANMLKRLSTHPNAEPFLTTDGEKLYFQYYDKLLAVRFADRKTHNPTQL